MVLSLHTSFTVINLLIFHFLYLEIDTSCAILYRTGESSQGQNNNTIRAIYADNRKSFMAETCSLLRNPDSVLGILTCWNFARSYIFHLLQIHPYRPQGPSSLLFKGYRVLSRGVKRPGREIDLQSHLMSSLRMTGAIPPYAFTAWTGDKPNVLHAACLFYNKIRLFFAALLLVSIYI